MTLEMAAVAYDKSLQELLRPIVELEADRLGRVPEIQTMVRAASELRAREAGKLTRLAQAEQQAPA